MAQVCLLETKKEAAGFRGRGSPASCCPAHCGSMMQIYSSLLFSSLLFSPQVKQTEVLITVASILTPLSLQLTHPAEALVAYFNADASLMPVWAISNS